MPDFAHKLNFGALPSASVLAGRVLIYPPKQFEHFRRIPWQTRKKLVRIPCVVAPRVMVNTAALLAKVLATLLRSIATAAIRNAAEISNSAEAGFRSKGAHLAPLLFVGDLCIILAWF